MDTISYQNIKDEYSVKRRKAQQIAEERRMEIYAKLPAIKNYDDEMLFLARTLIGAGDAAMAKLDRIELLTKERADLLVANGYPADYTNPPYECKICSDTGYAGTDMCECMKRRMRLESLKTSGLGKLASEQSFDNFSTAYYAGANKENAMFVHRTLRSFAENFSDTTFSNYLLMGGTGLGKTHLSTSLAKVVIDKGYDVVYTTVINMFDDFEKKRFASVGNENAHITDRYFNCKLLIIDDLGCELTTQFTVSSLYNIINTRLNEGKCTVINTNLSHDELKKKYDDRITSRIFGSFLPLPLKGTDIRAQKIKQ